MNRDEKAAVVDEIAGQIKSAEAVFAVDYRGLSVPQAAELRTKLRDADASFRVVKNSLTERAADQAGVEALKEYLVGPTALTVVRGDAALAAKTLSDTARALRGLLEFKGGLLNGAPLSAQDVGAIARLPSREVLQAQLVGTIAAPLTGLVRGLNALIAGVAIQLQQILEKGLVGGGEVAGVEAASAASIGSSVAGSGEGAESGAELPGGGESPTAVAEPEPEAAAEPEPELEPEPAAEPEPEPEAAAEPEPEAVAEPEPEPEAAPEPETDTTPAGSSAPEPARAAEPATELPMESAPADSTEPATELPMESAPADSTESDA